MKTTTKVTYREYAEKRAKSSPLLLNMLFAFLSGGSICVMGESLYMIFNSFIEDENKSYLYASLCLIFLAVLLTDLGIFDKIANTTGAGTLVPITGFANAMCSEALDAESEGYILGVGTKAFNVAGPVILFGTVGSVLYGIVYYVLGRIL